MVPGNLPSQLKIVFTGPSLHPNFSYTYPTQLPYTKGQTYILTTQLCSHVSNLGHHYDHFLPMHPIVTLHPHSAHVMWYKLRPSVQVRILNQLVGHNLVVPISIHTLKSCQALYRFPSLNQLCLPSASLCEGLSLPVPMPIC